MTFCDGAIWSSHIITFYDDSICHILFSQRVTQYINRHNCRLRTLVNALYYDDKKPSSIV